MTNEYDWLLKKSPRSVDGLKLWGQNPRLDPENYYITIRDFAEEIISSESDRNSFIDLAKSLANRKFIPADPIVVWQSEENQKFYVAEGNRRVLALKLLRNPLKAPRSIRGVFVKLSHDINKDDFEKIPVCVAPTFDDAEWYISQRNSMSSLQKRWSTEQQRRWVAELYSKYNGNLEIIKTKIEVTEPELQGIIRILKLKEFVKIIKDKLDDEVYRLAASHTFPLTTLDRFFNFKDVRDKWGIEFNGYELKLNCDYNSFLIAYAELIRRMLLPRGDKLRIDSRTIRTSEDALKILESLPIVLLVDLNNEDPTNGETNDEDQFNDSDSRDNKKSNQKSEEEKRKELKNNLNRNRLICSFYILETDSAKLSGLFNELKEIPFKYKHSIAASMRIFLDLSVAKYIETESLEADISKTFNNKPLRGIELQRRLEFLKQRITSGKANEVLKRLLNTDNEYSLDVLNGYMHSDNTHYSTPQFLNGFWDFMFPLFEKLLTIKEKEL